MRAEPQPYPDAGSIVEMNMELNRFPISVIVVNFNAGQRLVNCVNSVIEQTIEVIVVDNASTDDSLTRLTLAFPNHDNLRIVRNTENLGFAKACNLGLSADSVNSLLFLNPDCVVEPDGLKQLYDCLCRDKATGMVGGMLLNNDGSEQAGGRRAIPTPWRTLTRALGLSSLADRYPRIFSDFLLHKQPVPLHPIEVEAISGACMLVRRAALEDVGPLDEQYFLHCEDLDWCMRFRQHGWKIMFVPSARVIHFKGTCSRSRPIFVEWHKHKGMMRFYRKFFRHQYPGVLMGLVSAGVWLRFCLVAGRYSLQHAIRMLGVRRG